MERNSNVETLHISKHFQYEAVGKVSFFFFVYTCVNFSKDKLVIYVPNPKVL